MVYDVASGNCNADYNNALDDAFASLRLSVANYPTSRVTSLTAALANSSSIVVQPQLQSLLDGSAAIATQQLDRFLLEVQSTLSCSSLHGQLVAVQSSMCCSLTSSLYWAASAWFLIAFTLCCCEGPAAVYGSKRFSNRLVGATIAPGVLYDPHGQYQQQIQGGGPGGPGHDRTKLALMMTDSEGASVVELMKSPKYSDALLKGHLGDKSDTGATSPYGGGTGKPLEQCVMCLQDMVALATMAACGHRVCRQCARAHVQAEMSKRSYPILCPLSHLRRQSAPACSTPMADEDVMEGPERSAA